MRDVANIWSQQFKLVANEGTARDRFVISVGVHNDRKIVGARSDEQISGSTYVFS